MAFTYASVMRLASTALQDTGAVRWTAPELKDYVDQALVDIHAAKPNAKTGVVTLSLIEGTEQTLPAPYSALIAVTRNINAFTKAAIRMLPSLDSLSNWLPDWTDSTKIPNGSAIQYVYMDPITPRRFTVIPGAGPGQRIEAVVAMPPTPGAEPTGADALSIGKYTSAVDLPDQYQTAVLHLTLYRAWMKDADNAASAQLAVASHEKAYKVLADLIAADAISAGARVMTRTTA